MEIFEHLSNATGLGVEVIDLSGKKHYSSMNYRILSPFLYTLLTAIDCVTADETAVIYAFIKHDALTGDTSFKHRQGSHIAFHL